MSTKAIEALEVAKTELERVQLRTHHNSESWGRRENVLSMIYYALRLDPERMKGDLRSSPPAPSELVEAGEAMAELLEGPWFHYEENRDKVVAAWRKAKVSQTYPWISVETRLPEPYTWVLVFSDTSETGDFQFDIGRVIGGEWKCLGWDYPVTHWMPLPDNPLS